MKWTRTLSVACECGAVSEMKTAAYVPTASYLCAQCGVSLREAFAAAAVRAYLALGDNPPPDNVMRSNTKKA